MSTSGKIPGIVSKFVFLLRILALSLTFRSFLTCHSGWIHALSTLSKLYIREQCVCWTLWHLPFGRNSLLFTKWAFAWTYRLMSWKITFLNQVSDHCFKTIYNNLCYTTFSGILPKAKTESSLQLPQLLPLKGRGDGSRAHFQKNKRWPDCVPPI